MAEEMEVAKGEVVAMAVEGKGEVATAAVEMEVVVRAVAAMAVVEVAPEVAEHTGLSYPQIECRHRCLRQLLPSTRRRSEHQHSHSEPESRRRSRGLPAHPLECQDLTDHRHLSPLRSMRTCPWPY